MAEVLKQNVLLRKEPPHGEIFTFVAGQELPDWAKDRVGKHLFEDARASKTEAKEVERNLPVAPEVIPEDESEVTVPARGASAAAWKKFAKEANVQIPDRAKRDEIIALVEEAHPDLEIPGASS